MSLQCGNSSVGRARPCQGRGRESESRFPLIVMPRWWNGRHVGLKIQWPLWPCGFKSRPGYDNKANSLIIMGWLFILRHFVPYLSHKYEGCILISPSFVFYSWHNLYLFFVLFSLYLHLHNRILIKNEINLLNFRCCLCLLGM